MPCACPPSSQMRSRNRRSWLHWSSKASRSRSSIISKELPFFCAEVLPRPARAGLREPPAGAGGPRSPSQPAVVSYHRPAAGCTIARTRREGVLAGKPDGHDRALVVSDRRPVYLGIDPGAVWDSPGGQPLDPRALSGPCVIASVSARQARIFDPDLPADPKSLAPTRPVSKNRSVRTQATHAQPNAGGLPRDDRKSTTDPKFASADAGVDVELGCARRMCAKPDRRLDLGAADT